MQIQYDLDKKGIGGRLQLERERAGRTQETMAEAMGVTWKYISKVETGASAPSLSYVMKFSDITGSDFNYLLRGSYPKESAGYEGIIREPVIQYGDPARKLSKKSRKVCNEMMKKIIEVLEDNNI